MNETSKFLLQLTFDSNQAGIESSSTAKESIQKTKETVLSLLRAATIESCLEATLSKLDSKDSFIPQRLEKAKMQEFMETAKLTVSYLAETAQGTIQIITNIIKALKTISKIETKDAKERGDAKSDLEKFLSSIKQAITSQEACLSKAKAVKATLKTLTRSIESQAKSSIGSAIESGSYKIFNEIEPIIESAIKLCDETMDCLTRAQEDLKAV